MRLHGEAVSAGMVCASMLAERTGRIPAEITTRQRQLLAAFQLPVGQIGDPIRTDRGWFVIRVDARPTMDWAGFDAKKPQLRQTALASKENELMTEFLETLRNKAKIVDYRSS